MARPSATSFANGSLNSADRKKAVTTLPPQMQTPADPHRANARALGFLRVAVGILFMIFGQYKVFGTQFTLHGGFQLWINRFLQDGCYPFMAPILRGFVLPHGTPIAFLVAFGELAIGISLVLGVWVRPASAFAVIFMLSLLFSSDYPGAHAPLWQYFGASLDHSVLGLCFLSFLIGDSAAEWSLRSWRAQRES
jgi:thiosulfate dehydrogenase (quinone) large subunit